MKCVPAPSLAFSTQDPDGNPGLLPAVPEGPTDLARMYTCSADQAKAG